MKPEETLATIYKKFGLIPPRKSPTEISNCNRKIMAIFLKELKFNVGAEIGVFKVDHAKILLEANPGLGLFCVDSRTEYKGYNQYKGMMDAVYDVAIERLARYPLCRTIRKSSADASRDFVSNYLDFVYIDAAHDFEHVMTDIILWADKVKPGGIVFGHDYKDPIGTYENGVKKAVQLYCHNMKIHPWFILGEKGLKDGIFREGTQSWMFVKPL